MVRGSAGRMYTINELACYGAELPAPFYLALTEEKFPQLGFNLHRQDSSLWHKESSLTHANLINLCITMFICTKEAF